MMADAPIGPDLGSLPQVHALNCLKDIFTDARFGLSTEVYVADTMEIAASCLESQMYDCLYPLSELYDDSNVLLDGTYATAA